MPLPANQRSVRAVMIYKFTKGTLQLIAAIVIAIGLYHGGFRWLPALSKLLHRHATAAWSERASHMLLQLATPRHIALVALALGLDGALGWFEGFSLYRGYRWAETFVIAATSLPLPYELYELARRQHLGRALLLFANLTIVVLLILAKRRERES